MIITRFAPSPTGELHLGHAASALFAFRKAKEAAGAFLLRIEDIDPVRCKPSYIEGIYEDLAWLGLDWPVPVRIQSQHLEDYKSALMALQEQGLVYPCFCTRSEIVQEAARAFGAPHLGEEGPLYAGTCRGLSEEQRAAAFVSKLAVWRLDMAKACAKVGPLYWRDASTGKDISAQPQRFGDVVLARKDVPTSYHLSVVVDDALQGVTLVTRGEDLRPATDVHRLLQALLGLPAPAYWFHPMLLDSAGKRLAKRERSMTIRSMRETGLTQADAVTMALCSFK